MWVNPRLLDFDVASQTAQARARVTDATQEAARLEVMLRAPHLHPDVRALLEAGLRKVATRGARHVERLVGLGKPARARAEAAGRRLAAAEQRFAPGGAWICYANVDLGTATAEHTASGTRMAWSDTGVTVVLTKAAPESVVAAVAKAMQETA